MSMRFSLPRRCETVMPFALLVVAACGGAPAAPAPAPAPTPQVMPRDTAPPPRAATPAPPTPQLVPGVFGEFATRPVMVFPLQRYAVGDSGWLSASSATGRPRAAQFDSALTLALRERGLEPPWSLAPNTSRVAQRDVMNRTDPRALSTVGLVPSRRRNDLDLREPLSSQLRNLIALVPDSRFVLLPLETRVATTSAGQRQATLRLALLDARMATVLSFPDVIGAPAADEAGALRAVALKVADLIIVPR